MKTILSSLYMSLTLKRLACQIVEHEYSLDDTVFLGIQPRGVFFAHRLIEEIKQLSIGEVVHQGKLDITFYRDDLREGFKEINQTDIKTHINKKRVVFIDDVLYTGRTIRSAMDAIVDYGRPSIVQLCVLIDRRFKREFPIQPDYIGKEIDTIASQKVIVEWQEITGKDEVTLLNA